VHGIGPALRVQATDPQRGLEAPGQHALVLQGKIAMSVSVGTPVVLRFQGAPLGQTRLQILKPDVSVGIGLERASRVSIIDGRPGRV
jgi:hypothetical protein